MSEEDMLPEGWEYVKLEKLIKVKNGFAFKKDNFKEKGIPIVRISNLRENGLDYKKIVYCSKEDKSKFLNFELFEGDILVAMSGATTGKIGIVKKNNLPALLNQRVGKFIFNSDNLLNNYLLHYLKSNSFQELIKLTYQGCAQPNISSKQIENFQIPIPFPNDPKKSLKIQQKIVDKLDVFFEHYEKLKEEKQKAIENYDKILASTISKLIPSNEEDLPEGWEAILIGNILPDYKRSMKRGPFGSSLKKEFFVENGYKVYEQKNAIYNDFSLGKYYINEEKFKELKIFELKPGDLLISCAGTIGKCAIVPKEIKKGVINQALMKLTLDNKKVLVKYFYNFFNSNNFQNKILKGARGSAMKNLASVKEIKELKIGIPFPNDPEKSLKIQKQIVEEIQKAKTIQDKINEEREFIQKQLEDLPKSVLAKAFRGELI